MPVEIDAGLAVFANIKKSIVFRGHAGKILSSSIFCFNAFSNFGKLKIWNLKAINSLKVIIPNGRPSMYC